MNEIRCLDHGFVKLRNLAGPTRRVPADLEYEGCGKYSAQSNRPFDADDTDVANSARMSFDGMDGERTYETEMKLNRYLMLNKHMTPFESIEVWLEMKLPIFVARQFIRHRTFSFNEVSGRYVTLPAEWYVPEDVGAAAKDKKQGQVDGLDPHVQQWFKGGLATQCQAGYENYLFSIKSGVAPEHARLMLGLNHYTHWAMKGNLRNLMHFLALRDHSHAQIEAQVYAKAITQLLEPHLPGLMGLYRELVKGQA
jgi:thymidylate synthase (FAD)